MAETFRIFCSAGYLNINYARIIFNTSAINPIYINPDNTDVVKKFIFRYLSVPLTDGTRNILVNITNKDKFNKFIELNKFLSNICIIQLHYLV
jgi:hypothetical protein